MVNQSKIVKNSLWLYLRMFIVTGVALYTSRVVLCELGVEDFGIYNVTGSLVAFLSVLTTSLSNSTQRFLNIKKGEDDNEGIAYILGVSVNLHKIASFIIVLLSESVGVYFVLFVLVLPEHKQVEAFWCYQASVIALIFTFLRIPYMSLAVTYEKFAFIAWTSLVDVLIKLGMAFTLGWIVKYRLIYYGFSFTLMAILLYYVFRFYCNKIIKPQQVEIKNTFKSQESYALLSFSSWAMLGNISNVMANQGIGIVLNIFYSVVVNAAMGITNQVTNTIATFVNNVQQAFRPQLLQSYADKDKSSFFSLLFSTSRWSFFLLLLIAVPLVCNIKYVLTLWLGSYPEYTDSFIIILIGYLLIDSLGTPLMNGIEANGKVRRFQVNMSVLYLLNVVLALIMCYWGQSPNMVIISKLVVNIFIFLLKIIELKKVEKTFLVKLYFKKVLIPILPVFGFCLLYVFVAEQWEESLEKFCLSTLAFLITYIVLILFVGLSARERNYFISKILYKNETHKII